ncbi:MAG: potassium-transporting ATPase subunit KdpA, partial [Bdellovibrionales bacterium]
MIPDPALYRGWFELALYFCFLLVLAKPVGLYMAAVFDGRMRFLSAFEKRLYRLSGIDTTLDMNGRDYLKAVFLFSIASTLAFFAVLEAQTYPPVS